MPTTKYYNATLTSVNQETGDVVVTYPRTKAGNVKLATAVNEQTSLETVIQNMSATLASTSGASHTHANADVLDDITAAYTTEDATKLSGIATGAEVNQNAYSKVKVGETDIEASVKTDTLELAGSNVTLTPDASNDKVTIGITSQNVTDALGYTPYTPTEVDNKISAVNTGCDWKEAVANFAAIATTYPNPEDGWTVNVKDTNITYQYDGTSWIAISANAIPDATQSVSGLMTATDKTKLDGIATGAEVNQNAFSKVTVGAVDIDAAGKTDSVTFEGSNVQVSANASTKKVTIGITSSDVVAALGFTPGTSSFDGDYESLTNKPDLGTVAAKNVDSSIAAGSTSTNVPTSAAVASFVEGKGYLTSYTNTTYALSADTTNNKIVLTPSEGDAQSITVPYATDAGTVNGHTVGVNVPSNAVFTDTTYDPATASEDGLMSASDKSRLDGIAAGAEVNQNAFSAVTVGATTLNAQGKTDTLTLTAGSNVTLTPDTSNGSVTVSAQDTTYNNATTSAAGLMSATDKSNLDTVKAYYDQIVAAGGNTLVIDLTNAEETTGI